MRNYECLRGGHGYRDIYGELRRIEERGRRIKESRKPIFLNLFRSSRKERQENGVTLSTRPVKGTVSP